MFVCLFVCLTSSALPLALFVMHFFPDTVSQTNCLQLANEKFLLRIKGCGLGCSLVVQCLPSMCEALGSIPAPKKTKKKKKKNKGLLPSVELGKISKERKKKKKFH
jgi:hypothetical protein